MVRTGVDVTDRAALDSLAGELGGGSLDVLVVMVGVLEPVSLEPGFTVDEHGALLLYQEREDRDVSDGDGGRIAGSAPRERSRRR